jgi:hypothetical protein
MLDPLPDYITQQFTPNAIKYFKSYFGQLSKAHKQYELLAQATASTAAPVVASASATAVAAASTSRCYVFDDDDLFQT